MTFKVVQLTDTHLFASRDQNQKGVNTYRTLEAVVADVARNHPDFDALLLTGDLSQDETPESYDNLIRLLAPIRGAPIHAIPGNHDDPSLMRARLGGQGVAVLSDVVLGHWRILMLDSRIPDRVAGEIGDQQRQRLKQVLDANETYVIVALHHPPVPVHSAWIDALGCLDGGKLLAEVADPPVKAVVCGHVHQAFEVKWRGATILTTPSTCVQFKPGSDRFAIDDALPGYRVFELADNGYWSSEVLRIESTALE